MDKLDYLQELGINAIYFNPLNDAPSLHKFDARNYRHIDVNFGPDPEGDIAIMSREDPWDPSTWQWTSADRMFLDLGGRGAMNPAFAEGVGDLSVHEAATSPTRNDLVYFSYYSGGFRVLKITADEKLQEVGRFIDQGGNDFWGVQVFSQGGKEYVAASDLDYGLYIFEYTGSD